MSAHAFRTAADQLPSLRRAMQLYAEATVTSMGWWVACNRAHVIEQRFARWLLMCHDRVLGDEFVLTQEFIAQMMGIRRASVSEVAGQFHAAGYITYTRGQMRILDRAGLELRTCECYGWLPANGTVCSVRITLRSPRAGVSRASASVTRPTWHVTK